MADKKLIEGVSGDKGNNPAKALVKEGAKKGTKETVKAGVKVGGLYFLAKQGLKNLLLMLLNMVKAIASFVSSTISTLAGALVSFGISATLSSILSVGIIVATVVSLIFGTIVVSGIFEQYSLVDQDDCGSKSRKKAQESEEVGKPLTEENAKKVYSVFKSYGLDDTNIAGILGNWSAESGIDSTSVEGIMNEPFVFGERKQKAFDDLSGYTKRLIDEYIANGKRINAQAYNVFGKYYAGIGLGQWTGPRCKRLLDFAEARDKNWYDLDLQLEFMLTPNESGGDAGRFDFKAWKKESSPESATLKFGYGWEGNISETAAKRSAQAKMWYSVMNKWSIDKDYADSVLSQIGKNLVKADTKRSKKFGKRCGEDKKYDNSSLAMAAVSYAYENERLATGNNGTPLYQKLMRAIFPKDQHFMSCDRSVAVAVRWSGVDESYPIGAVVNQEQYMIHSDKWKKIDWGGDESKLEPGDIFITYGKGIYDHIVMYVGNEAIRAKFPNAPADFVTVSGSLGQRSPGCGVIYDDLRRFDVYRNVKSDNGTKYKHLGKVDFKEKKEK